MIETKKKSNLLNRVKNLFDRVIRGKQNISSFQRNRVLSFYYDHLSLQIRMN